LHDLITWQALSARPSFKTGFFFKPAIVFGSKEAMEEYRTFEAGPYTTLATSSATRAPRQAPPATSYILHTPHHPPQTARHVIHHTHDMSSTTATSSATQCDGACVRPRFEAGLPGDAALPETFRELHTQYGQGLALVPTSAQLELTLPISAQLKLTLSPMSPTLIRRCVPRVLKLSSNVSDVSRRSSS
jgi:hypothetical protein